MFNQRLSFQDAFCLAFKFGVNPTLGYGAHAPNVAQMWPCIN